MARERTDGTKWDWSALPIFLSRGHHWPYLYVNTGSGIASLADMKGKRIGVPDYDMTAALWFRNTLKDLYGIEAKDNVWFNGRTKELSHGGALGLDKTGAVDPEIQQCGNGGTGGNSGADGGVDGGGRGGTSGVGGAGSGGRGCGCGEAGYGALLR